MKNGEHSSSEKLPAKLVRVLRSSPDILREKRLKLAADFPAATPLSWPLSLDDTRELVVRWPVKLQWDEAEKWVHHLLLGFRRHVKVEPAEIPQPCGGSVVFELVWQGKTHSVTIDYWDHMDRIQTPCLDKSLLYFKMQYLRPGYGSDKILPGGFINASADYYKYIAWLRALQAEQGGKFAVYGRFGLRYAGEIRRRAVEILKADRRFSFTGDLTLVRYSRSLAESACAKICLDLPGNGDFCFRLADYLGIGCCIVAPRHGTTLPIPLEDKKHIVFAREDLSDLADLCHYYLEHEEECRQIAQYSREYFDRYLHRDQLAAYYLSKCLERLKAL